MPKRKKLRLVKIVTQAHFVVDDGTELGELIATPVTVTAADWPTYATTKFADDQAGLEEQINAAPAPPEPAAAP